MKRFTSEWWGNHFQYNWWKYAAIVLVASIGWSMLFSATEYRVPPERRVHIYFAGPYVSYEKLEELRAEMSEALPEIEEIQCFGISLDGDAEVQAASVQKLSLYLGAGEGDIYLLPRQWFLSLVNSDGCLPLDEYLASGGLSPTEDIAKGYVTQKEGAFEGRHLFGVPMSGQYGFITREGYDNRNIVAVVTSFSKNPDQAARVVQWMVDNRTEEKPANLK